MRTVTGPDAAAAATSSPQARYYQLADDLRAQITSGQLAPGDALPSEPELAAATGTSRTTVRNAIKLLRGWGLVQVYRGRGSFVRPRQRLVRRNATERYRFEKGQVHKPEFERRAAGSMEMDTGSLISETTFEALITKVPASREIAETFGVPVGTDLLRREYRQVATGDAFPARTGAGYLIYDDATKNPELLDPTKEPWPGGTQHQLWTLGIELDRISDEVTARPPTPDEASILGLDEGVSVLAIRKVSIDTQDRVVEVSDIVMPGDRTALLYTIDLPRWPK